MKNKKTVKVNLKKCTKGGKLPKYDMGGDTPDKKLFNTNTFGQLGNLAGAASGAINSELDWKNTEKYSVANDPLQKTIESGLGSNPITSAFMGLGKAGEALGDSVAPGLGEGLFSPHKSVMRAFKEGKPQYMIPIVGSMIAAADSQKQLNQEELDKTKMINPYGETTLKLGGALIKYDAPSHENGGQMITSTGAETSNPNKAIAEIEKKETMHNGYVFSDTLKASNDKTFAAVSKTIENRFKSKNDPISEKTRKLQLDLLKGQNETLKNQVENMTPMMQNGGDPIKGVTIKNLLDSEKRQMDMVATPNKDIIDTSKKILSQEEKARLIQEEARLQEIVDARMYNLDNGTPWLADQMKTMNKQAKQADTNEYLKTANIPIVVKKHGGKLHKMYNGGDPDPRDTEAMGNMMALLRGATEEKGGLPQVPNFMALANLDNMMTTMKEAKVNTGTTPEKIDPRDAANMLNMQTYLKNATIENGTVTKPNKSYTDKTTPVTTKESNGMDYLTPARIGKGIEMAGKAGILSAGYDKVKPELNPEAAKVKDLMKNRINNQALLNQINLQRNAALASNNDARSLNVKRALDTRTYNSAANAAMTAKLQEQMQNNAYKQQEAGVLSQLGSEEARAKVYAEDATARNKGQWLTNLGTVLGDVGRAGEFETKVKVNDMQVAESLAMLGMKYEDYGVDATTYKRLKEGKYTIADVEKLQEGLIKYKGNGK